MKKLPPMNTLLPFLTTAEHKSCTQAGKILHLTHSAVSQSIKRLETYLGETLFTRDGKNMELNDVGLRYYQAVKQSLNHIESATQLAKEWSNKPIITINMLTSFAMQWLIPKLPDFQAKHPEYTLRLHSQWRDIDFHNEAFDFAIRYGSGGWDNIASTRVFEEEIGVFCSPSILSDNEVMLLEEAKKKHQFLYVTANRREDNFTAYCRHLEVEPPPKEQRLYFENTLQTRQAAIGGQGLMAANIHFMEEDITQKQLCLACVETAHTGHGYYLTHKKNVESEKTALFKDWFFSQTR